MRIHHEPKAVAEKRLRALDREWNHLGKLDREAPLVALNEPYPRGWERRFELSAAALRRNDCHRLEKLLPVIQQIDRSKTREFKHYDWRQKKVAAWLHLPLRFSLRSFRRLRLPEELWGYFETHAHHPLGTPGFVNHLRRIHWGGPIHFRFPEYLVSKTVPHLITHRKIDQPEVTSRLTEIESILERNGGWGKLSRLEGRRHRYWSQPDRRKLLERVHLREILEAIQEWEEQRGDEQKGAARSAPFSLPGCSFPSPHFRTKKRGRAVGNRRHRANIAPNHGSTSHPDPAASRFA